MKKLGIALQWALIKLRVLKSLGVKSKSGYYMTQGMYKKNPLSWIVLFIIAVPVIGYEIIMAIKNSCIELWQTFED